MDDDQGLQWWAELGQHEVAEFTEWLDKVDAEPTVWSTKRLMGSPAPVTLAFKGERNGFYCER